MDAMTKKQIIKLLKQELKWCKENKKDFPELEESYKEGFIKGIEQCIDLIKSV